MTIPALIAAGLVLVGISLFLGFDLGRARAIPSPPEPWRVDRTGLCPHHLVAEAVVGPDGDVDEVLGWGPMLAAAGASNELVVVLMKIAARGRLDPEDIAAFQRAGIHVPAGRFQ